LICRQTTFKKNPIYFEYLFAHLKKFLPQAEDGNRKEMKEKNEKYFLMLYLPRLRAFEKLQVFH